MNASNSARTRRQSSLSFERVWESAGSTTSCEYTATQSFRNSGLRSLERLFPGFTVDSVTQATLSAGQSRTGYKRASYIAAPAHEGTLEAVKPRIQAMIHDAVWAGLLPMQPWRLAKAPLMMKIKPRRSCMFRRRLRQQTKQTLGGLQGPSVENPSSASQDDDSEDMDFSAPRESRLIAPQLQAQLSRLTDRTRPRRPKSTLHSKGAWQKTCATRPVSHKWLCHLDAFDNITNVQKRLGNSAWTGFGECRLCGSFLDPQSEHGEACRTAEATRGHLRMRSRCGMRFFFCSAVPGRSAALDVCVASSNAAAAQGDAAQASFDRKLSLQRRNFGIAQPGAFTVALLSGKNIAFLSGRRTGDHTQPSREHSNTLLTSHPVGTASRCRQNRSQRRRKEEIKLLFYVGEQPWHGQFCQIRLHGQKGSSPVSLTGPCITGATLDGGLGDCDHADSETDTAIPDVDDDIASLASQSFASMQPSSL